MPATLLVVDDPARWPLRIPDVEVVAARAYLADPGFSERRRLKVFNLCRSYRYQSVGYYVSLLAEARGHRPRPSVTTIQDMKTPAILRTLSGEADDLIQRSLAPIKSREFTLSIYFGRNVAKRYDRLSAELSSLFEAPLLRASFVRSSNGHWHLAGIRPVPASEIPENHREEALRFAQEYFAGRAGTRRPRTVARYDLAILWDPAAEEPPSDERALRRFERAARELGMRPVRLTRDDFGRLGEFDALFVRETTAVNHYTYRFARRAAREGLVVIDDPVSIVRCTNKVYLAELFGRCRVPTPRTEIVHRDNADQVLARLGLPCVLKRPDSSFSAGVVKVETEEGYRRAVAEFLDKSELFIAQEFVPTVFDWRVGVFAGEPLWACRYHMAKKHWQIIHHGAVRDRYGKVDTVPLADVPPRVLRVAVKAAGLIGNGLYGVDLKETNGSVKVIEVNDNPSLEAGFEDQVLGMELYRRIMRGFLDRIEARTRGTLRV